MSERGEREVVRETDGRKWHRVWWPPFMEANGVCMTHVGAYRPDRWQRLPKADVDPMDLCLVCYPLHTPVPHPDPAATGVGEEG